MILKGKPRDRPLNPPPEPRNLVEKPVPRGQRGGLSAGPARRNSSGPKGSFGSTAQLLLKNCANLCPKSRYAGPFRRKIDPKIRSTDSKTRKIDPKSGLTSRVWRFICPESRFLSRKNAADCPDSKHYLNLNCQVFPKVCVISK